MKPKQSTVDEHEILVMIARWQLLGRSGPFHEIKTGINYQVYKHVCPHKYDLNILRDNPPVLSRNIQMWNADNTQLGMVGVGQCDLCGTICWQRVVCRERAILHGTGHVCRLPRYHSGKCEFVPMAQESEAEK